MKLRIVSDGTHGGTHVHDETGQELRGVISIEWWLEAPGNARAKIVLRDVPATLTTEAEARHA